MSAKDIDDTNLAPSGAPATSGYAFVPSLNKFLPLGAIDNGDGTASAKMTGVAGVTSTVAQGAAGGAPWLVDVNDRVARLLGHVIVDSLPATSSDVSDRAARLLGHVTVDGTVATSGAPTLAVVNAISSLAFNLAAAPFTATTALAADFLLSRLELHFTTAAARTIVLKMADNGSVLWSRTNDTSLDITVDYDWLSFDAANALTLTVTQTGSACLVDVRLAVVTGAVSLAGNPVLGAGTAAIGTVGVTSTPAVGTHANAWNAAAVGINGTSTAVDCQYESIVSIFGNVSAATTIQVQYSQNNSNWYAGPNKVLAGPGDFYLDLITGTRYIRLLSTAAATITATIAGKD